MANLIPQSAKKNIIREYWTRAVTVWLVMFATAVLVVTLLLAPVYLLIMSQLNGYSEAYSEASQQSDEFGAIESAITSSNETAALLLQTSDYRQLSEYLTMTRNLSGEAVSIDGFVWNMVDPITVSGQAATRADLAAYKTVLEESVLFERVELPISSLASEHDIDFSMLLTPRLESTNE